MIRIFYLTRMGHRLSSSTSAPQNTAWRILYYLRMVGHGTPDSIADHVGVREGEASATLSHLKRKGLVTELGQEYKI